MQWSDRPTALRPPVEIDGEHDYLTEIHSQGEAFVRTLADRLVLGAALLLDYGFPESEYYHVQRHMGTVMCHQAHRSDPDPLQAVGLKDITAHVNFTGIALGRAGRRLGRVGLHQPSPLSDQLRPGRGHARRSIARACGGPKAHSGARNG